MSKSSKNESHQAPFSLTVMEEDKQCKEFPLNSKTILIGRKGAEIVIADSRASRCHALIEISKEGKIKIKDLKSKNGTYINNRRITEGRFNIGDILLIGKTKLSLQDNRINKDSIAFEDTRIGIELSTNMKDFEKTQNLIKNSKKLSPKNSKLKMIDGAFCDIIFNDSKFKGHSRAVNDILHWDPKKRDYIDIYDSVPSAKDIIEKKPKGYSLEVTTLLSGNIISRDYLPLINGTYYAGKYKREGKVIEVPSLRDNKKISFIKVQKGTPFILRLPTFKIRNSKQCLDEDIDQVAIEKNDIFSIEQGMMQLLIRYSFIPPILSAPPILELNKKDVIKATSTLMLIIILASLSTLVHKKVEEPEEKKVSIIYKPQPKVKIENKFQPKDAAQTMASEASKKASNQQSKQNREKKTVKKVAKTSAPPSPSPKTYKKSTKLKNLFRSLSTSSNAPRIVQNSSTSSTTQSLTSSVQQVSGSGTVKTSYGSPGKLGAGTSGKYDLSTGSKGLSAKQGISKVSYKIPGAVVSGSGIDQKLLAKILKELIPQFKHCYQRELLKNEEIEGVINLLFRIHGNGTINNIKVKGENFSFSAQGNDCIKRAITTVRTRFPRPPKGGVADIKQPLDFSSTK